MDSSRYLRAINEIGTIEEYWQGRSEESQLLTDFSRKFSELGFQAKGWPSVSELTTGKDLRLGPENESHVDEFTLVICWY
jgi:hypothetical protein